MFCSFPSTGLLPPWLNLFLGTLFFLLLYQMGFFSLFLFLQFCCWYTGMPLISEYWLCIQLFCQIQLLRRVRFGGVYRVFYVHYHVICKQWQFYFLLSNLDAFIAFSCLITVARTCSTLCWIKVVRADTLVLFLIFRGKILVFACWVWCWL